MSDDTVTPITLSDSEWYVRPSADGSCFEICRSDNDEVIAITDEPGDASVMACAKNMLNTLIAIQSLLTFEVPNDAPIQKHSATADEIKIILDVINVPFEKIANEVTL